MSGGKELSERLERIITSESTDPSVALVLLLELVNETRTTIRSVSTKIDDVSAKIDSVETSIENRIDAVEETVEEIKRTTTDNPSIVWLLRFRTVPTMISIAIVFAILSALYISDFRNLILHSLGINVPIVGP